MKFVRAIWKLLVGIKDALVLMFMLLFFGRALRGAFGASRAPIGEGVLDLDLDGSVVEQPSRRHMRRRCGGPARIQRISACATSSRRSTRRGTTTASRRSRSTSTAFSAAARPRSAICQTRCAASALPASRSSLMPPVTATTATSSRQRLPRSGSTHLGGVADRGTGRLQPLLQGPARQARGDRQRLPRRHLQIGGRAVHPQRHVARSEGELHRPSARRCSKPGARTCKQAVPRPNIDLFLRDMTGAVAAAGRRHGQGGARCRPRRQVSATAALSRRGLPSSAAGRGSNGGGLQADQAGSYIADVVDQSPSGPIGVVTIAGDDRRRQGPSRHRRRRHALPRRSRTASRRQAQGAGRARRQPGRFGARVRAHPPGACSPPRTRSCRSWCRWAASRRPAATGSRPRPTSSSPSRRPSPDRSACSESLPSFQGTLQKLGVGADGVKTTPLSGEPDLLKGPSPEADQLIQAGVESMLPPLPRPSSRASRHKTPQQIDQIAQGRVWDGGTARQLGLVDGFGGLERSDRQGGGARQARRRTWCALS